MKLTGLYNWYNSIKTHKLTYDIFDLSYNNINLSILFDIGTSPFKLVLIRTEDAFVITFEIKKGFRIETGLTKDQYCLLRQILNIPNGKNCPFSTNSFFEELNNIFPNSVCKKIIGSTILNKIYNFEECEKLIYNGLINWEISRSQKHHTVKNHEKTRILYPKIYEEIKDKDISVRYK